MITINLYDYKTIIRDVGIQRRLWWVVVGSFVTLVLCFGIWMFQNMLIWNTQTELAEVQSKVAAATPDYNAVQKLKKEQTHYVKIITGIDKLRSDQSRTTEFLEDIGGAVPEGVWLTSIKQMTMDEIKNAKIPFLFIDYEAKKARKRKKKKGKEKLSDKFVELTGVGKGDQSIVQFLEQLRAIPYIDAVVLSNSERTWMENQPVQKYSIYCHFLKPKPAA
jgi:hypothetical protein